MQPRNTRKPAPPLDAESLRELALAYVGRYATTKAKLARYLARKLRERGWSGEGAPQIEALADRCETLGFVDDRAWGEAKARELAARGYGARRVTGALYAGGVEEALRGEIAEAQDAREALTRYARRRRFGPYASEAPDRETAQKQFAAMLRAGHPVELVRELMRAETGEGFEAL